jgi:hypothetical protein
MTEDMQHKLWLIYSQLKEVENDPEQRSDLLQRSREQLGEVINELNRQAQPDLYTFLSSAGARGGAAKTEAKAAAARANGAKGGRPPEKIPVTILATTITGQVIAMMGSAGSAGAAAAGKPINYLEMEALLNDFLKDFDILPQRWQMDEPIFTSATKESLLKWFGVTL